MTDNINLLHRFADMLADFTIKDRKKLKILNSLLDIELTLTEIHDSNIVKHVKRLKKCDTLCDSVHKLLEKWKSLLTDHFDSSVNYSDSSIKAPSKSSQSHKKTVLSKSSSIKDGIDSSSGLSFMDSLSFQSSLKIHKKHKNERTEKLKKDILQSLENIEVDYADNQQSSSSNLNILLQSNSANDIDDGDLKFKSARIIYAPIKSTNDSLSNHSKLAANGHVPSLIELCVEVLRRNISQVDHVGHLPWFIFEKAIKDASVKDLVRIEKTNPQFVKNMRGMFDKFVHRDFPKVNWEEILKQNSKEPHGQLYMQLHEENEKRLNSFINRTANRVKQVRDAQRSVQNTPVISPRNVQRARHSVIPSNSSSQNNYSKISCSSTNSWIKPRNMSYGDEFTSKTSSNLNETSSTVKPSPSLMNQLKRKFVSNTSSTSKLSKFS